MTCRAAGTNSAARAQETAILVGSREEFVGELDSAIGSGERIVIVGSERARNSKTLPEHLFAGRSVHWFTDFDSNPNLASACAAAALVLEIQPSMILALGGGSAMDVAKAARVLPPGIADALAMVRSHHSQPRIDRLRGAPKVVALPTLSGSGAEVTQFATLFHERRKISVDDLGVRPDLAIIDPSLALTAPHLPTSAATLDALCHAIESAWSRSATAESRTHSLRALRHLSAVEWKVDGSYSLGDRHAIAAGALSAGLAINLTRTTAAHASAYALTALYSIPHGVACALNGQWVARANAAAPALEPEFITVIDRSLGISAADLSAYFSDRLSSAGWPSRLGDYGIGRKDLPAIVSDSMLQTRLRNNPIDLSATDVEYGLSTIL
jgi:alcohol dehydrogenase class IV